MSDPIVSPDSDNLKFCSTCGELKPRGEFNKHARHKDGLATQCRACTRAIGKSWRAEHPDYHNEYRATHRERENETQRAYYAAHKDKYHARNVANAEKRREYDAAKLAANRDTLRGQWREYHAANREERNEAHRKWNESNPDYYAEYRKKNPEKLRAKTHRRRARKAGNGGTYTIEELAAVRAAQTDKRGRLLCWECGKPIKGTPHLDHWIPIAKGGRNDAGNLHYMHARCNLKKNAKHPTELGRLV
jgi:hypothetical protein